MLRFAIPPKLRGQQGALALLKEAAPQELVQVLAQYVADKDAPAGGSLPRETSALVYLNQRATFLKEMGA